MAGFECLGTKLMLTSVSCLADLSDTYLFLFSLEKDILLIAYIR
jgi:hypothetical protein